VDIAAMECACLWARYSR